MFVFSNYGKFALEYLNLIQKVEGSRV